MTDSTTVTVTDNEEEEVTQPEETSETTEEEPEGKTEVKTKMDHIKERAQKKKEREEKLRSKISELEEEIELLRDDKPSNPNSNQSFEELFNQRAEKEEKISEFIKKYPGLEQHKEKIRKYAHDPSRKGIPIDEVIVGAIGFEEFIKIGATLKQEADTDAIESQVGGRSPGEVKNLTEEQKRAQKFNQTPKFLRNAEKIYKEQIS